MLELMKERADATVSALSLFINQLFLSHRDKLLLASHIRAERHRNIHASVCIEVILKECDQHTRRSYHGIIQRMCKIFIAVLALDADL